MNYSIYVPANILSMLVCSFLLSFFYRFYINTAKKWPLYCGLVFLAVTSLYYTYELAQLLKERWFADNNIYSGRFERRWRAFLIHLQLGLCPILFLSYPYFDIVTRRKYQRIGLAILVVSMLFLAFELVAFSNLYEDLRLVDSVYDLPS